MSTALVWLRRDLRLADHPALAAACAAHDRVLPVYIHAPQEEGSWAPGAASRWWLHQTLATLSQMLAGRGGQLHLAAGDTRESLERLIAQSGASAVYWTRCYEPAVIERDSGIEAALRQRGITAESQPGNLLVEPWRVSGSQQRPYKVFTPFWRKLESQLTPLRPLPAPRPRHWARLEGGLPLEALELEPRIAWAGGLAASWRPGEAGARGQLAPLLGPCARGLRGGPRSAGAGRHLAPLAASAFRRDHSAADPSCPARSVPRARASQPTWRFGAYLRELGWREFAHHMLYHFPGTCERNFNRRFDAFPWAEADAGGARALAARPDGCADRRCRHAGAVGHRLDAQPRADGRRLAF